MNRWQTKTGLGLARAVMKLAADKAINEVTVAELCRDAGTTRDTFYRYAASPIEVLAAALNEDLAEFSRSVEAFKGDARSYESLLMSSARELLEHVKRNQAIYRHALRPHLDSALRDVLISRIETVIIEYLALHPDVPPDVRGIRPNKKELLILAAWQASGSVGVIERWVKDRRSLDIERMLDLIFTASAPWWFGRTGTTQTPRPHGRKS